MMLRLGYDTLEVDVVSVNFPTVTDLHNWLNNWLEKFNSQRQL